jgi:hypothetical protein
MVHGTAILGTALLLIPTDEDQAAAPAPRVGVYGVVGIRGQEMVQEY